MNFYKSVLSVIPEKGFTEEHAFCADGTGLSHREIDKQTSTTKKAFKVMKLL